MKCKNCDKIVKNNRIKCSACGRLLCHECKRLSLVCKDCVIELQDQALINDYFKEKYSEGIRI